MIKLGETGIEKLYLGETEIVKAYLGESLVYDAGGSPTPPTPTYTDLFFVKLTGSQYILIDYQPSPDSKIEIDMQFEPNANTPSTSANNGIFAMYNDTSEGRFTCNFGGNASQYNSINYWFQGGYVSETWVGNYTNIFNRGTWVYQNNQVSFLGVTTTTETKTTTQNGQLVIGANANLSKIFNRNDLKIYSIKLYTNNILLHNLVPRTDGTHVGLYDTITDEFIYSSSGTELVASPILPSGYTQLESISNGEGNLGHGARINTGVKTDDNNYKFVGSWARTGTPYTSSAGIMSNFNSTSHNFTGLYRNNTSEAKVNAGMNTKYTSCTAVTFAVNLNKMNYFILERGYITLDGTKTSIATTAGTSNSVVVRIANGNYPLRLGRLRIYHSSDLIADMVPCKRNNDNVVGMYDVVRESFYVSGTSYSFSE